MLPVQKNKQLIQQIKRIFRRMQHIKQVKNQLYKFIDQAQQLYSTFAQQINKQMILFQQKIIKNSLYSTQKTTNIINLGKVYRQFSIQLQKNSKINILNLQRIKNDEIIKQESKLQKVCNNFTNGYLKYIEDQINFNILYAKYSDKCSKLDEIIKQYSTFQDPLEFYNYTNTNQYITQLDKQYSQCSSNQINIINAIQGLDQARKWHSEEIKDINQNYVILLHIYLVIIQRIIYSTIDPNKQQNASKNKLGLRSEDSGQNHHNLQLQKLNNLYSSELNHQHNYIQDNIIGQYQQLFKNHFNQNQLHSDYKLFYDRCLNLRSKKMKTTEEIIKIQSLLIKQLITQKNNCQKFQTSYKAMEKDVFTNNGVASFKKKFRKYFGSNFMEIEELCMIIIERKNKSLYKIGKCIQDNEQKFEKLLQSKIQAMKMFEKRTKLILDDHLQMRDKAQKNKQSIDKEQLKIFKQSISLSFTQLKKSFMELQKSQSEIDKMFFKNLKIQYEMIVKETIGKTLFKILQKQKNRVNILNNLNVQSEIVLILKQDSRYQMLSNQCPKPNLYSTFQSLIKKKEFQETKLLLQKKDERLKTMSRPSKGCCGLTSEPIKHNIISSHQCKLKANDKSYKGKLSIANVGLMFQQSSWNPFVKDLNITIPANDVTFYENKVINNKNCIQIGTNFGKLIFRTEEGNEIIQSIGKNIIPKIPKEGSQRGGKSRSDSGSFFKQNTSTDFKLSFDKTLKDMSQIKKEPKGKSKTKTFDMMIKQLVVKWKQNQFLSKCFTKVQKNNKEVNENRRDYQYKNGHTKFYLKQKIEHKLQDKNLLLFYEWKISFPQSPMIHSFKYSQKIVVQNILKDLVINIMPSIYDDEQLYIRTIFYKQIEDMNTQISKFIVNTFEKQADIKTIMPQVDDTKSLDSGNIVIDDINLQQRQSKFQKAQSTLRNSRLQKNNSYKSFISTANGFKAN